MTVYLDSSVVLRIVLGEPSPLVTEGRLDGAVTSRLLQVECLRTLDRLRLARPQRAHEVSDARVAVYEIVRSLAMIEVNAAVLERASLPLPVPLGTLDAIHLATALLYREQEDAEVSIATHDAQLGLAARATGFRVIGD